MARLVASGATSISTDSISLSSLLYGTITVANSGFISVNYGGGAATEFYGSFSYDASGRNITGGTLGAVRELANGSLLYTLDGMSVSAPVFVGWVNNGQTATARATILAGSDTIYGSDYGDTLRAYAGDDTIYGAGGNDLLDGGTGVNLIDGGADTDTVARSASRSSSAVVSYAGHIYVGDAGGYDKLANVEYIRFTDQTVSVSTAPAFDPLSYLAANTDVASAVGVNPGAALNHYLTAGGRERRSTAFNVDGYLASNPDLATVFGANTAAATQHYITAGRLEGRNTSFNVMSYIAANPDLIGAFGANTTAAALHYATAGRLEGRPSTFNTAAYLSRNPDVQRALGTSELAAATHYVTNGYREGRSATPLASTSTRSAMGLESTQQSTTLAAGW
jgi:hypothetical protein